MQPFFLALVDLKLQDLDTMTDRYQLEEIVLRRADDMHVHLRQGDMMRAVTPMVRAGGVARCVVMPNTNPPVVNSAAAIQYRDALRRIDDGVDYLMTLYLTPELAPRDVQLAAAAGVVGVKLYPRGVTTNSASGVEDLSAYHDVFSAMQDSGLVLQVHGEVPSNAEEGICVLNAEERFLPRVTELHARFPHLKIVLEHVTTAAAVGIVTNLGDTVAATITAHHLSLTVDDWAGKNHNFCKPVAKMPDDRAALRAAVESGSPKFFLGSDSAPHPRSAKECACACAGVFSSPLLLPYLADVFDEMGCLSHLGAFCCRHGASFYGLPEQTETLRLARKKQFVPGDYEGIVPFRAGEQLGWSLVQN